MTDTLTVRIDHETKKGFEAACDALGISMGTVVNMLAKNMAHSYRIPAELCSADPFYSEANQKALEESIRQEKEGKLHTFTWEAFEELARKAENG